MRKYYLIIIIFQSLIASVFSQNFFPLKIGNKYQYEYHYYFNGSNTVSYPKVIISEDTLINTQQFFNFDGFWYSYNNVEQKLYILLQDSILLAADFNLPPDSTQMMYFHGIAKPWKSNGQTNEIVFGELRTVFEMNVYESGGYPGYVWSKSWKMKFADDIGLIRNYYNEFEDYGHNQISITRVKELYCAILDTAIYNPQILDVQLLTPLENRPLNQFPFNLRVTLNINNINLLDTLYTDVYVYRQDSILVTHNTFIISTTTFQTTINLDSAILDVNDVVRIRCVAADYTIFENFATDPDSGFFEFTVLPASTTGISSETVIRDYNLVQNFPNPFNPITKIRYEIPELSFVSLKVYDTLGNELTILVNEVKPAGNYVTEFKATDLPTGIYFYRIQTGNFAETKKMVLMK